MSFQYPKCFSCQQLINDRLFYECDQRLWHQKCLKCQMCSHAPQMNEKLYSLANGLLVCRQDYQQIQCVCRICAHVIDNNDLFFRAQKNCFIHAKCMLCARCRRGLETGDKYVLNENQLICQKCCQTAQQQYSANNAINVNTTTTTTTTNGRRGRKRANNTSI